VLVYYAIANAAAWTLSTDEGRPARMIPVLGLAGCVVLAFALPPKSVIVGTVVLALGVAIYGLRRARNACPQRRRRDGDTASR
jgi:APA family basic amino acid/polyamine antiporter